jgi:mannose-1-phosphate guanylyltransferase/mannose-6-phosphate isomerase
MALVIPVILCGGSGTRLWPLSRSGFPKQFLVLSGDGSSQSLFQQAVTRINSVANSTITLGNTLVVTNEGHRFLALDQLREIKSVHATLLLEPAGRNTAPALSMAAFCAQQLSGDDQDPILVITPADQTIQNQAVFTKALQDCIATVEASNQVICILGITPRAPETGYGYIARSGREDQNNAYIVDRFVEKPDLKKAQEYLASGSHLWNSGMFVLMASTWLTALK